MIIIGHQKTKNHINKIIYSLFLLIILSACTTTNYKNNLDDSITIEHLPSNDLVESARAQIGVVTKYDTSYYQGGYPPQGQGACTDVIEQALRNNSYDLKRLIDQDMTNNPDSYPQDSDPNINFRRVRNVKIFLDRHAIKLTTCVSKDCFQNKEWQAGDIVTFDQIPGSLWHIAIISNKVKINNSVPIPYLIHNYGNGVVEDNRLLNWPAPINGHYRITEISTNNINQ